MLYLPEKYLIAAVVLAVVALAAVVVELAELVVVVGIILSLIVTDYAKWIVVTWREAELSTWSSC